MTLRRWLSSWGMLEIGNLEYPGRDRMQMQSGHTFMGMENSSRRDLTWIKESES